MTPFKDPKTPLEIAYNEEDKLFKKRSISKNYFAIGTDKNGSDNLLIGINQFNGTRPKMLIDYLVQLVKKSKENPAWSKKKNDDFIKSIIRMKEEKGTRIYVFFGKKNGGLNTYDDLLEMQEKGFNNTDGTQGELKALVESGFTFNKSDGKGVYMTYGGKK